MNLNKSLPGRLRIRSLLAVGTLLLGVGYTQLSLASPKVYSGAEAMQQPELAGVAWRKAVLAGNAQAVCDMYADDSIAFMPDKLVLRGKAEICEYFTKWLDANTVTQEIIDIKYKIVDKKHMLGWGIYKTTATPKNGGAPVVVTGSAFDYSEKRHGKWITLIDHVSVQQPDKQPKD
jgi:ketosteroid isomerase-like protein